MNFYQLHSILPILLLINFTPHFLFFCLSTSLHISYSSAYQLHSTLLILLPINFLFFCLSTSLHTSYSSVYHSTSLSYHSFLSPFQESQAYFTLVMQHFSTTHHYLPNMNSLCNLFCIKQVFLYREMFLFFQHTRTIYICAPMLNM